MQELEASAAEIEKLRRANRRWKLTAIFTLAVLITALPVDVLKTRALMNQITLERERVLQAEQQADVQRQEFLRSLLSLAQDATRYSQQKNATNKTKKETSQQTSSKSK
jgi:hypothetical protein